MAIVCLLPEVYVQPMLDMLDQSYPSSFSAVKFGSLAAILLLLPLFFDFCLELEEVVENSGHSFKRIELLLFYVFFSDTTSKTCSLSFVFC